MKKASLFALFMLFLGVVTINAQYNTINVIREDYVTISSKEGICVTSVTPNQDKSYTVVLKNNNNNAGGEIKNYCFDWYLSYKGKRVSDYFQETIRCGRTATRQVYCWPGEVPSGYERYVTVQLGKEQKPVKKDPRDDD